MKKILKYRSDLTIIWDNKKNIFLFSPNDCIPFRDVYKEPRKPILQEAEFYITSWKWENFKYSGYEPVIITHLPQNIVQSEKKFYDFSLKLILDLDKVRKYSPRDEQRIVELYKNHLESFLNTKIEIVKSRYFENKYFEFQIYKYLYLEV